MSVISESDQVAERTIPEGAFKFTSRGIGNNWLPCFICGHKPVHKVQHDLAGFVPRSDVRNFLSIPERYVHPLADLCHDVGVLGELVTSRISEGRVQFKFGACGEHLPNLRLLDEVAGRQGYIDRATLEACIPGRKIP